MDIDQNKADEAVLALLCLTLDEVPGVQFESIGEDRIRFHYLDRIQKGSECQVRRIFRYRAARLYTFMGPEWALFPRFHFSSGAIASCLSPKKCGASYPPSSPPSDNR